MRLKDSYSSMNDDIRALIGELKNRRKMNDDDVGKLIGLKGSTIRNYRSAGILPSISFCKVVGLAKLAGYQVKFERKD